MYGMPWIRRARRRSRAARSWCIPGHGEQLVFNSGAAELLLYSGGIFPAGASIRGAGTRKRCYAARIACEFYSVEVVVAHLIQAMTSFNAEANAGGSSQGALFESVSGGTFQVDSATLAPASWFVARWAVKIGIFSIVSC
jgi:hypothetical protein